MERFKKVISLVLAITTVGALMCTNVFAAQTVQATMTSNSSNYSSWSTGSGYAQGYAQGVNQTDNIPSRVRMTVKMSTYPNTTQTVWSNILSGSIMGGGGWVTGYTYPTGNNTSVYQVQLSLYSGSVYYATGKVSPK